MNPFDLVKAQHMAGQVKEAAENYRKILELEPDFVPAINMLGNAMLDLGDYDQAIEEYERALKLEPDFYAAHYNMGNALCKLKRLDEAAAAYRRAIEIKPDFANAYFNLGNVLLDLGRPTEALEEYEKTLELAPDDESTHFNRGKALAMLQRDEDAIEAYRKAVEIKPDFLRAHSEMGHTLIRLGRPLEALTQFQKAIELEPEAASEHFNLGMTLFMLERHQEAETAFRRALELEPDSGRIYESLGQALLEQDRREEAVELLREWLRRDPENPRALHLLAAWSGGQTPAKASESYIRAEFDRLAADFDSTLARLKYLAPILIAEALRKFERTKPEAYVIADVGCGTGLAGPILRPLAKELVGVDLSEQMLAMAKGRELYDELVNEELTSYLRSQPARFDIIISADTFVYFGVLDEAIGASASALRPDGVLVFTTELLEAGEGTPDYVLNASGRYSHSEPYVRRTLEGAGLIVDQCQKAFLRMEGNQSVQGLVVVARRPASS